MQQYLSQVVDVHPAPLSALTEVHGCAHQQDISHTIAVDVHRSDLTPVVRAYLRHRDGERQWGWAAERPCLSGAGEPRTALDLEFRVKISCPLTSTPPMEWTCLISSSFLPLFSPVIHPHHHSSFFSLFNFIN